MAKYIAEPQARVLADSISPHGHRLTTMEVTMHRFVLAEFNTHRVFSRNSASSRAIPGRLQRDRVLESPAVPLEWPESAKGMQGGQPLPENTQAACDALWGYAGASMVEYAEKLSALGVHKSVTNRLLEPFLFQTVIVTSTEWDGFFAQRDSELAQPEIAVPARLMREAYEASTPKKVDTNQWHTPLIDKDDLLAIGKFNQRMGGDKNEFNQMVLAVSAARCARVSYLTHDGKRDITKDFELYHRLITADPPHWSPLEHVATPCTCGKAPLPQEGVVYQSDIDRGYIDVGIGLGKIRHKGNFTGWDQLRHTLET